MTSKIKIFGLDLKVGDIVKLTLSDKIVRFEVEITTNIFGSTISELTEVEYMI